MTARVLIGAVAALTLWGADPAGAFIAANTIDGQSTYTAGGMRVRATGPIGCTSGEHLSIRVTVTQPAIGARARESWNGRCTGEIQHWQVRARARHRTRFETRTGRVCAVATTRDTAGVTDTRKWCERVAVSERFS